MAIAYDAQSSGTGSANPWTWSHTCSGTERFLVVAITSSGIAGTAVTYNGVSMTLLATVGIGVTKFFYLSNPASGTNTISVSGSSSGQQGCAVSYTGVDPTGNPSVTSLTDSGAATTTITNSINTTVDNSWVIGMGEYENINLVSLVASTGATQRVNLASDFGTGYAIGIFDSNGPKTPAGSYSMTLNVSGLSGRMILWNLALKPYVAPTSGMFSFF